MAPIRACDGAAVVAVDLLRVAEIVRQRALEHPQADAIGGRPLEHGADTDARCLVREVGREARTNPEPLRDVARDAREHAGREGRRGPRHGQRPEAAVEQVEGLADRGDRAVGAKDGFVAVHRHVGCVEMDGYAAIG